MTESTYPVVTAAELAEWVNDARQRTFELVADLSGQQLMGPKRSIVNPLLWEIGHQAWFQEKWVLRHACKKRMIRDDADSLWDSIAIPHATRWDLPLPSYEHTLAYLNEVRLRVLEELERGDPGEELVYFIRYTTLHEDMHTEAITYTRQTLGYSQPKLSALGDGEPFKSSGKAGAGEKYLPGDVEIPGGQFMLGASSDEPFVFDNEKWAHRVTVEPFAIARTAVTQSEFAAFANDRGYRRRELWSEEGWQWREAAKADNPAYWRPDSDGAWRRRHFNEWVSLEPQLPVIHVNWHEAQAYCRWAGRRLPTEAEWEVAAAAEPDPRGRTLARRKRSFPWGDDPADLEKVNMDWQAMGCIGVGALSEGDSAFGCRQMIGNVWEWTNSVFLPYPGFETDPYKEYSEPWFGTRKVLRGGSWATRSRMLRNTLRNFFTPDRRDVFAGFRTCAPRS